MKGSGFLRRTPLLRKSPMSRGAAAVKQTPATASRLRRVSKKHAASQRLLARQVEHLREFQDWCSKCGHTFPKDMLHPHHFKGRAQGGGHELENLTLLCDPCNVWIEDNPREAAEQGWKFSKKYQMFLEQP